MAEINLKTEEASLIINIEEKEMGWSQIFYLSKNKKEYIGSEVLYIIVEKFLHMLKNYKTKEKINYKEIEGFLVINLMDPHASIFASPKKEDDIELYVLDKKRFYFILKVEKNYIKNWIFVLESLNKTYEGGIS